MFPPRLNSQVLLVMSAVWMLFSKIVSLEAIFFYYVWYSWVCLPVNACSLILEGACVRLLGTVYKDQYINLWRGGSGTEEKIKEGWGKSDRKIMAVKAGRWQTIKPSDVEMRSRGVVQGASDLVTVNGNLAFCREAAAPLCCFLGLKKKKKKKVKHIMIFVCIFPGGTESWCLNLQAIKSVVLALALTWRLKDEQGKAITTFGAMFDLLGFLFSSV